MQASHYSQRHFRADNPSKPQRQPWQKKRDPRRRSNRTLYLICNDGIRRSCTTMPTHTNKVQIELRG